MAHHVNVERHNNVWSSHSLHLFLKQRNSDKKTPED